MISLCFDSLGEHKIGYPNLARPGLKPHEFDSTWPCAIPFRIQMYLRSVAVPVTVCTVDNAPLGSWYPVSFGWHDFDCDYFELLTPLVRDRLRGHEIKLLFHYHEGDNPERIQQRFNQLCEKHNLPASCYVFISANSAADNLKNFYYFPDHENFFKYVNRYQPATKINHSPRNFVFTALSRSHKWWRATCMSQLLNQQLLDNSLWSYNTQCLVGDRSEDNPICMSKEEQQIMHDFLSKGPYFCDSDDSDAHNNHRVVAEHLYTHSYCNLVLETLFDADQSGGAFITEKTYKCIKFGQPFIIIGAAGSLRALRAAGYRVFDDVIDNSYDNIENNTQRWHSVQRTIQSIKQQDLYQWYLKCLPDLLHNQQIFMQEQTPELRKLIEFLTADPNII